MVQRVYQVQDNRTGNIRLVQAESRQQLGQHLLKGAFDVKSSNGVTTAKLLAQGIKLEVANTTPNGEI